MVDTWVLHYDSSPGIMYQYLNARFQSQIAMPLDLAPNISTQTLNLCSELDSIDSRRSTRYRSMTLDVVIGNETRGFAGVVISSFKLVLITQQAFIANKLNSGDLGHTSTPEAATIFVTAQFSHILELCTLMHLYKTWKSPVTAL